MNVVMLNDEPFGLKEIYQVYPEIEHVIYLSKLIGKCNMSIRNASLESLEKVAVCIVGWDTRNKEYRSCNAYHVLMDKIYDNMGMNPVFKATAPESATELIPCMCGANAIIRVAVDGWRQARCTKCNNKTSYYPTEQQAIQVWEYIAQYKER